MSFADLFKIFNYSFSADPITKKKKATEFSGAGITQPDAMPNLRDGDWSGGGSIRLRDSNDFLDMSVVSDRKSRYKEYERLRSIAEIEMAMTVFADETCLAGETKVATLFDGLVPIKELAERKNKEDFLVYSWDGAKNDFTLAWAYDARVVGKRKTIKVFLDDGTQFVATPEHRVLNSKAEWVYTASLKFGDELIPFYRLRTPQEIATNKFNQFPRIRTLGDGWKHERQFINEWKTGRAEQRLQKVNKACRMLAQGLTVRQTAKLMGHEWNTVEKMISKEGFTTKELKWLGKKPNARKVVGVQMGPEVDVYDLSVRDHANFCGESIVFHNCQRGDNNHMFSIECKDQEIKEELEFLFFNRDMLNFDRKLWNVAKKLFIKGDQFWELCIDSENPKAGVLKIQELPAETMFRIETTKGKLIEFQQSKDAPDYQAVARLPVTSATEEELRSSGVMRFTPEQIVHLKIGDDRMEFFPYGVSLIEAARGPAHSLRMMEDAMMVYRLTRAPERRVFYIDVGQVPPFKQEAYVERIKDQFKKKKVPRINSGQTGASAVEEKWHAPAQDEDYWLPIRPNSNTRIETLPGAQNLGEVDDVKYFRDKVFIALNFPKNYFNTEDVQSTRIALSAQDVKFARMVERLQEYIQDALWHVADRHLTFRGYPKKSYEDLIIKLTPPSDWREMSRAEVTTNRINNANSLKGSLLYSDYDIYIDVLKIPEDKAKEMLARLTMQKLNELKLQIYSQNPQLLGIGVPGQNSPGQEIGSEAGGPSPMLSPDGSPQGPEGTPPPDSGGDGGPPPESGGDDGSAPDGGKPSAGPALAEPSPQEIKKYDLQVQTYSTESDKEDIDWSVES